MSRDNIIDRQEMGRKIKMQRLAKNLTQENVVEKADINPSYLSAIESGSKKASLEKLVSVVNAVDGSFDHILAKDLKLNDKSMKIDANLIEFRNILEIIDDKELAREYISYCRAIAKTMIKNKRNEDVDI